MNQDYKPGILTTIKSNIFFFMVMNFCFILSLIPSLAWLLLIEPSLLNMIPLSLIGPSLTALFCCMIKFKETDFDKEDLPTSVDFRSFYKKNFIDTLRFWVPYVMIMMILYINATYFNGNQQTRLIVASIAILGSVVSTLSVTYMLAINAKFKFGVKDLFKLSMFYILTDIKANISIIVVYFLAIGVAIVISDFILLFVASVIGYLFVMYTYSALEHVRDSFTESS